LGPLAPFNKMLAQSGHDFPSFGWSARPNFLSDEPIHAAESTYPFPDLLLVLASERANPSRKVRRAEAAFVGRENEVRYRPKSFPLLASVHHNVVEAEAVWQQKSTD
jgi:hypothetical protein